MKKGKQSPLYKHAHNGIGTDSFRRKEKKLVEEEEGKN